jgi:hypothetical protein
MHPWDDPRRYSAALHEQARINEEAAERARSESKRGGNLGFLLFIIAVIFLKPFAEYCFELYHTVAGCVRSLAGFVGF